MRLFPNSDIIPGLLFTIGIATVAFVVNHYLPLFGAASIALLLGIIIGNSFKPGPIYSDGIRFSETMLLSTAITLMGLKMDMTTMAGFGSLLGYLIIPLVTITIITALIIGRVFKLQSTLSLLLGVGNAICGTSAIAVVSPSTRATREEAGIAIGVVNMIGTIGMLLLPMLIINTGFDQKGSALLIGGSLQAVGQVVAAGNIISESVGDLATLFKMSRVLMIIPLVIFIPMIMKRGETKSSVRKKLHLPVYLIGFLICSALVSFIGSDSSAIKWLIYLEKILLIVAMAGIGLKIEFKKILTVAPRALLVCTIVTLVQISLIVLYLSMS